MSDLMREDLFKQEYEAYRGEIESCLDSYLPAEGSVEAGLREAMAYSLLAGGKRFRPVLLMAVFDSLGGSADNRGAALTLASALEMIHTYSLIHDDLPSMDNDDYRRGQLTNHKQFNEATAILAGDALLNRAYELMFEVCLSAGTAGIEASRAIARFAGSEGLIGGQMIDLTSEGQDLSVERLEELQRLKTGGLLRAACAAGGHLAIVNRSGDPVLNNDNEILRLLDDYGSTLGLAFQIRDDILDLTANFDQLGKSVGKDERDTKVTFVTMMGLDGAEERLETERQKTLAICEALRAESVDPQFLIDIAEWQIQRKA